jgi:putative oxidoreductase
MNVPAAVAPVARLLIALMFILAGISKFGGLEGTAGYIASRGLPLSAVLAFLTATLEVVAGLAILVGFQTRLAALALAIFTLVATVLFHNYWAMPVEQQMTQQLMFMKNLSITGGLLLLVTFGAGAYSLDARRSAA